MSDAPWALACPTRAPREYDQGEKHFRTAASAYTDAFDKQSVTRTKALSGLGQTQRLTGNSAAAVLPFEQALATAQGRLHGLEAALGVTETRAIARQHVIKASGRCVVGARNPRTCP
jgi:hypothetical protein